MIEVIQQQEKVGAVLNLIHINRRGVLGAVKVKGCDHKMVEFRILKRENIKSQNIQAQLKWCCQ